MHGKLVGFIVLMVAIFAALYLSGPASNYAALRDRGQQATAVISPATCKKSLEFQYTFIVNLRAYSGNESVIGCDRFIQGRALQIVFLPDDPTINYYDEPALAYANYVRSSILGALILSGGLLAAFHLVRMGRARSVA